ncbi:MAG: (2Fe-2S)-binding protein [Cellvibrionales bacterium TMED148]|nr:(2Fe-2S)-binding protein [Porticoccaceae bacterium]RPG91340.1 MAG: (2Fe-2S)-binding protein [Cellvibrionales bacterium TMED148]
MLTLDINGKKQPINSEPDTPLLWVLRDELALTGTKYGCGIAMCGACTVHMDGEPVRACAIPIEVLGNKKIVTIEHQKKDGLLSLVQEKWLEHDVAQCGYCQSGQIMSATALLNENPNPSDQQIEAAMSGNICRCGTYQRVRNAIRAASDTITENASL